MLNYKKIIAVLPAYNAAKTLVATVNDIDRGLFLQQVERLREGFTHYR